MLYSLDDERVTKYDENELMGILENNRYHSPEDSETDVEGNGKRKINVYNLSWRSNKV